tara:strand:+ start:1809 stop:2627 length:819 start_codon:yes stop_codon:yes gene_type:complete
MSINNIAIIAGRGILPQLIINQLQAQNKKFIILTLNSEEYQINYQKYQHYSISYGLVEPVIKILKDNNIKNIIFAGAVNKPNFSKLKTDKLGKIILGKILANKILGDDAVLRSVIKFLEKYNINIIPIDKIIDCQIKQKGVITRNQPTKSDLKNIIIAKKAIKTFSKFDIGQSVLISQKQIIAIEGVLGTDNMITNSKNIDHEQFSDITLVKLKKINQTSKADLPTIGVDTIINCHKSNIKGIAIETNSTLLLEKDKIIKKANELNIFITAI